MKNTSKFTAFVAALLLIISCKKEPVDNNITVSGTIVKDCAGTPYANQSFTYVNLGRGFMEERDEVAFTTDAVGNFEFKCPKRNPSEPSEIKIGNSGGFTILEFEPTQDLNLEELITRPAANYKISLKINNPYQIGDTLQINNHKGPSGITYKFPAPLNDTTFPIVYNYSNTLQIYTLEHINKVLIESTPSVYSGINGTSSLQVKWRKHNYFYLEGCKSGVQEIVVNID